MSRRKSQDLAIVALLTGVPWWSVPIAVVGSIVFVVLVRQRVPAPDPLLQWALNFVVVAVTMIFTTGWLRGRQRRQLLEAERDLEGLRAMPWRDFELLVGQYFRTQEFKVIERGGADGGVDLELRRGGEIVLVQCKRWRERVVKVQPVRELWGVVSHERATGAVFVTSGRFTDDARAFAEGKTYRLIDGEELLRVVAAARPAAKPTTAPGQPIAADTAPACPNCRAAMVRRAGVAGRPDFWGCSTYPRCRGLVPIS